MPFSISLNMDRAFPGLGEDHLTEIWDYSFMSWRASGKAVNRLA